MKNVNIAELKNQLSRYLNEVRAGADNVVRDRNLPIARIVPIRADTTGDAELSALAAQGKIRLGEEAIDASFWKLPAPRVSAAALRRTLDRERDES
jgi:prevent-host-death family protein